MLIQTRVGLTHLGLSIAMIVTGALPAIAVEAPSTDAGSVPAVQPEASPAALEPDPMAEAAASGERVEDVSKRDGFSATFANPDGTWTAEISTGRVHFRDSQGVWQRVDTSLVPTDRPGYEAVTKASSARAFVPEEAAATPVRVEDSAGRFVSMRLLGAAGAPQVEPDRARVPDGPAATSVTYAPMPSGMKETITIPTLPAQAPAFEYEVRATPGLSARVADDNTVEFTDETGEVVFGVPTPFMVDNGGAGESSDAVPMTLRETAAGWRLTATPDWGWLSDPERVFPVLVDPSVTTDTVVRDTYLDQGVPNTTHGSGIRLWVGADPDGNRRRTLIRFPNKTEIPTWETVTDAKITLYLDGARNSHVDEYAIYRMKDETATGGTAWDASATWNGSGTGTSWVGAGGAWVGNVDAFRLRMSGIDPGFKSWDVDGIAQNWVSTGWSTNNGVLMKTVDEPAGNNMVFVSENASTTSRWPKLSITWEAPAPVVAGAPGVSPSVQATVEGAATTVARLLTPTLTATASDADSPTLDWRFEVQQPDGTPVQAWSGTKANPTPGQPVSFSQNVPAGVLAENGAYKLVFSIADETTSGVTSNRAFTVDQPPAVPDGLTVSPSTDGEAGLTTTVTDPELSAVVSDATESVAAEFELSTSQDDSGVFLTGSDEVESGQRAVFALSPEDGETLTPGTTYYFRVGSSDAIDAQQTPVPVTWSDWVAFTVARDAAESIPLQLDEPLTVWDTGPVLTWTPYRDDPDIADDDLIKYEVFRTCLTDRGAACANTAEGSIAVLDPGATSYRDRSAKPSGGSTSSVDASTFRYRVAARTVADGTGAPTRFSNDREVVMPLTGRVRRVFIGSDIPDATISQGQPAQTAPGVLEVDSNDTDGEGTQRGLVDFDVSIIQPGMRITSAWVEVNQQVNGAGNAAGSGTFGLHELVGQDFVEDQATWNQASATDPWPAGGEFKPTATATTSVTAGPRSVRFADSAAMRAMVARWVNQRGDNHGLLLKAADEAATPRALLDLVPSESAQQNLDTLTEMRPRLTVEHVTTSTLATIQANAMPQRFVPGSTINVPVTVTNTTDTLFKPGLVLGYRWTLPPNGTEDQLTASSGRTVELLDTGTPGGGMDATDGLAPGEKVRVMLPVLPPINSDTGSAVTEYHLELDLWDPTTNTWYTRSPDNYRYYDQSTLTPDQVAARDDLLADEACAMMPTGLKCPYRLVETPTSSGLGLEKFATYAGEETGAGSQALVNLANGNLVWTYDAISNPSVGPSFFARVAYNSSDVGAISANPSGGFGWSVQPGTLSRLNTRLIFSGSDYKAVTLVDGDGTAHVWRDPVDADGAGPGTTKTYQRPAGVAIDLRYHPDAADAGKRWEFYRPDGTRFYFKDGPAGDKTVGLPTSVVDISDNTLTYTYDPTTALLTKVTDDKGRTVGEIAYNADGRVTAVCDVDDRTVTFEYRTVQPSHLGTLRDGRQSSPAGACSPTNIVSDSSTKTFAFTYTDDQSNDSTNLSWVTDPRGAKTGFSFYGTNVGTPSGRLQTWIDRGSVGDGVGGTSGSGRTTRLEYYNPADTPPPGYTTMPEGSSTMARVTDETTLVAGQTGYQTIYAMDGYGRTVHMRDPEATHPNSPSSEAATLLTWDEDHNVVRMEEPSGAVSRWVYNADGYPTRMWDAEAVADGGPPTRLHYTPVGDVTFLDSITTPLGNTSTFAHDARGRLTSVTDPEGGTTFYVYDNGAASGDGLVTSETDPRGNLTTYAYPTGAANIGLPIRVTPPAATAGGDTEKDAVTDYAYDTRGNTTSVTRTVLAGGTVTDQITAATAAYDVYGRPTAVTTAGAQGPDRTIRYRYDRNDNLDTETAPNQAVTTHAYGRDDQEVRTTLPGNGSTGAGSARTVSYAYDSLGRLCRQVAPKGSHPADLTQIGCPAGAGTNPPAFATDTWYDAFNARGRVVSTTAGLNAQVATAKETYTAGGDLVDVTDPRASAAAGAATTEYVYDLNHRPTQVIDALGYATRTVYDDDGQVVRTVDAEGHPTRFDYDKAGRMIASTVLYDRPGRPVAQHTTRYVYDAAGNQTKVIRPKPDTDAGEADRPLFYSRTLYDELNRPTVLQQAHNPGAGEYTQTATTFTSYDAFGRITAQSVPVYTPAVADSTVNPPAPPTTPALEWTRYTYYDSGDIASSRDPSGITTSYAYTMTGQQSRRTITGATDTGDAADQSRTMTWAYHPDDSLKARSDTASTSVEAMVDNPTGVAIGDWPTQTPTGQDGRGGQQGTDYRLHDTAAAGTPAAGDTFTWTFTAPADGNYRIEFSCPAIARNNDGDSLEPSTRSDAATYTITSGTNPAITATGDHTGCGDAPWRSLKQGGNPSINLTAGGLTTIRLATSTTGTVVADAIRVVDTNLTRDYTYTYDANGQRTGIHDDTPGAFITDFTTSYDELGRPTQVTELRDTTEIRQATYTHDLNDNPTHVATSRAAVDGSNPLTRTTEYDWDARNNLDTLTANNTSDPDQARTWDYTWNPRGLLQTLVKPGANATAPGNTTRYGYFANGLMRFKVEKTPAGAVVARHDLLYNPDSDLTRDITEIQVPDGTGTRRQTSHYSYTPDQRLAGVEKSGKNSGKDEAYTYDAAGNITKQTIGTGPGSTTTSVYKHNRLVSSTTNGVPGQTDYHYDTFGRLDEVTGAGPHIGYVYDGFDRVKSHTRADITKTVTYDALDRAAEDTVTKTGGNSRTTRYVYLGTSEQVAAEEQKNPSDAWQVTKAYNYGPEGRPVMLTATPINGETKNRLYTTNPRGDVEALTDPNATGAGSVTATYRYYAYGNPDESGTLGEDANTAKPGTLTEPVNPYRYNAKRADTALGGIDMGFRNYDPGINSFTTRDSYNGALDDLKLGLDPWNTNRYAYAGGNPITRVELDGHLAAPVDVEIYDQEKVDEIKQEFNASADATSSSSSGATWYEAGYASHLQGQGEMALGFAASAADLADTAINGVLMQRGLDDELGEADAGTWVRNMGKKAGYSTDSPLFYVGYAGSFFAPSGVGAARAAPRVPRLLSLGRGAWQRLAARFKTPAANAGDDLTRVGRWMSQSEYDQMVKSSRVIEGGGGRTYVVRPPNPETYKPGKGVYAEFDVPTSSLHPAGGNPNYAVIPGPNAGTTRFGPLPTQMPRATCIELVCRR